LWWKVYDPSRKSLKAVGEYSKENLNVAAQFVDWASPGDVARIEQIAPGEGAVVRHQLHKIAVYRDMGGTICALDATCPHLGCIVDWNSTEKTWDCPCHGSRFDIHGRVVNGPTSASLSPIQLPTRGD
jgi:Rieske Fe-S protein